jgi:Putative zinc-finger
VSGPVHNPVDLGAHALGLLDAAQARAVEEHIATCATCRREWGELRQVVEVLGEIPPETFLEGPPDGDLVLQRTLRQMRAETAARRRRGRWVGAVGAVVAAAAVLGGGVAIGRAVAPGTAPTAVAQAPTPGQEPGMTMHGEADGVEMTAVVRPARGWVRLAVTVRGIPTDERCRLMVVARDGRREVAGTWLAPPRGEREDIPLDGAAIVAPEDVEAVVVENEAGREFVAARA